MKTQIILFVFTACFTKAMFAQDKKAKIKDYLHKEIMIEDNFAGQSITLIKENNDYLILRKFFGAGVNVAGSSKYVVVFNSEYQIAFSDPVESSVIKSIDDKREYFLLAVEEKDICLYINNLKVFIREKESFQSATTKN